jgi:hypothetical protein
MHLNNRLFLAAFQRWCGQNPLLALPTKARILCLDSFIIEHSSLRDFGSEVIICLFLHENF